MWNYLALMGNHPAMVYFNSFWNNFRKETEKQQASRLMKYIASEWDEGKEVSKSEIDRLEFFLWVIRSEMELENYDQT